jgi:hypothetical protein
MEKKHPLFDSGDIFLPEPLRKLLSTHIIGNDESTFYITYWSIVHFISGMLCAVALLRFTRLRPIYSYGFIIHTTWELWQVNIGMAKPMNISGENNIVDSVVDTILFLLGMAFAARFL